MSAQNDALVADRLRLKVTATTDQFAVHTYTIEGGTNVTAQMAAGTYITPLLAPGATHLVKVVVTVRSAAQAGSSLNTSMVLKSNSDPTRRDTVEFVTSRT